MKADKKVLVSAVLPRRCRIRYENNIKNPLLKHVSEADCLI